MKDDVGENCYRRLNTEIEILVAKKIDMLK
jgi:hypothetical protein